MHLTRTRVIGDERQPRVLEPCVLPQQVQVCRQLEPLASHEREVQLLPYLREKEEQLPHTFCCERGM